MLSGRGLVGNCTMLSGRGLRWNCTMLLGRGLRGLPGRLKLKLGLQRENRLGFFWSSNRREAWKETISS